MSSACPYGLARPRGAGALAVFATVVATGCATFPRAPDEGGSPWILVETPHFAIATDMEAVPAKDLGRALEDAWKVMEHAVDSLPGGVLETAVGDEAILVIALKSDREREAVERPFSGRFRAEKLLPPTMTIGNIDTRENVELLQHELAHALLWKRLPRLPKWLNEGLAVYLETAELDRERHTAEWGIWSEHVMRRMREYEIPRVPVETVFDSERWKKRGNYALYVEAGLLVHMLVNRHPDELACYIRKIARDLDPNAESECFEHRSRWNGEVKAYDYETPAAARRWSVEFPDFKAHVTPMDDARVHAVLAMLDYMAVGTVEGTFRENRLARAERHLKRALELDPADQLAILLTLTETTPDKARQVELTKRLVDRHPDHWASWIARVEMPDITGEEQSAALDRAWALAPWRIEVIGSAAFRAFASSRWSDARTLAIKAWLGGLDGDDNRALVYAASVRAGSCAEAASWLPASKDRKAFIARVTRMSESMNAPPASCPLPP